MRKRLAQPRLGAKRTVAPYGAGQSQASGTSTDSICSQLRNRPPSQCEPITPASTRCRSRLLPRGCDRARRRTARSGPERRPRAPAPIATPGRQRKRAPAATTRTAPLRPLQPRGRSRGQSLGSRDAGARYRPSGRRALRRPMTSVGTVIDRSSSSITPARWITPRSAARIEWPTPSRICAAGVGVNVAAGQGRARTRRRRVSSR